MCDTRNHDIVFKSSRRTFMQQMCAGTAALAAAGVMSAAMPASAQASRPAPAEDEAWGLLIDLTRCTGCQSCALACKEANDRPNPEDAPSVLSSDAYSVVERKDLPADDGEVTTVYVKRQCMHCVEPACVSVCTVGALRKSSAGPVVYDADKCIGCRYCQYACPHGIPAYDWDNPLGLIHKCQMCVQRIDQGETPACVTACPNGALRFGKRQMLLAQAHAQISSNPGRYVDHVYGEHEAGGASVLYLSPISFAALGFPSLAGASITEHGVAMMERTPIVALTVAAVASALHLLLKRREAHAEFVPQPVRKKTVHRPETTAQRNENEEQS